MASIPVNVLPSPKNEVALTTPTTFNFSTLYLSSWSQCDTFDILYSTFNIGWEQKLLKMNTINRTKNKRKYLCSSRCPLCIFVFQTVEKKNLFRSKIQPLILIIHQTIWRRTLNMRQRWRQETSGAGAASLTSSNSSQGQKVDIW